MGLISVTCNAELMNTEDELGRVKEGIARNVSAAKSDSLRAVKEIDPVMGTGDELSSVEPRPSQLCESNGTTASDTAFNRAHLGGEGPTPVGN